MIFLLLLSFLQLTFLPGYIVRGFIYYRETILGRYINIFILSILLNYIFVLPLVFFGLFTHQICLLAIFIEGCAAGALFFRKKGPIKHIEVNADVFSLLAISVALITIGVCIKEIFESTPSVFTAWDAVVSWNRWAVDWYNGLPARQTREYPQLLITA